MRFSVLIGVLALTAIGSPAWAQTSKVPPTASGAATMSDDKSGAIRSLGSADSDKRDKGVVTVPQMGTDAPSRTGGAPRGTATGPR